MATEGVVKCFSICRCRGDTMATKELLNAFLCKSEEMRIRGI